MTVQVSQVNVWKSYYIAALTLKQYNETIVWNRESWADGGYSYTPDTSISLLFTTKRSYVASAMAKVTRNPSRDEYTRTSRDIYRIICLLTYPLNYKIDYTQNNLIQLKTFKLELDFAEYIQHTDVRIAYLCWFP